MLAHDEVERAEVVLRDALEAIRDIDYKQILPMALRAVAQLATRRGDAVTAARWYGAADGVMVALGMELPVARRVVHERAVTAVRERLGEAAFATAWAAGGALSLDEALAALSALADQPTPSPADHRRGQTSVLTPRERDIVRLLVEGRSDKEIAATLGIGRRTVSWHLGTIRGKLEAPSRSAVAAIALRDHLV